MAKYSEACKELDSLIVEVELTLDSKKYPHLAAMCRRGNKLNWGDYFSKRGNGDEA